LIDACVYYHWSSQREITDYLPRGWREFLRQPERYATGVDEIPILPLYPYHRPDGDELLDASGSLVAAGYDALRDGVLDAQGVERAILFPRLGMLMPSVPNPHLAREATQAINDWTIDRWLDRDERLRGLILVPSQTPEDAVGEIERLAGEVRMAGVLMAANPMSKPFGHPIYHPIYRAAVESDLPVVFHTGGDASPESLTAPAGGGPPSSYAEHAAFTPQPFMTHLVSMIAQGVFVKYPELRVLVAGAGAAWLPAIFWRFDIEYRAYRRETPWLTERPTDTLRRQIRLTTYPLDVAPRPAQVRQLLESFPGMEKILLYASGFPSWDTDTPDGIRERIPRSWQDAVFSGNAQEFFRWRVPAERRERTADVVGAMELTHP
jgi:predicted TIM-barrel fold metal-dependent hydrolase